MWLKFGVVCYDSITEPILTEVEIFTLYQVIYMYLYVRLYGEHKPCFYSTVPYPTSWLPFSRNLKSFSEFMFGI